MATASKTNFPGTGHTAGIYADLSIDGPIIGTLVAVIDRAKNLPNRKTIGKQDPYCAARLGKEAKKTTTDIRGGQTPKWDQELRFAVHDSPDYYQLKISIFTDDKKTDLVGEAWIDLKSIIVSGGGQADVWQSLSCKGKYSGEIRLEITFYDSRPKPENKKSKQHSATDLETSRQKTPYAKRRPLPSDPITGEAPPVTAPIPITAIPQELHGPQETPMRLIKQSSHFSKIPSQSPLQAVEYNTPQGARHQSVDGHGSSPGAIAILGYSKTPSRQPRRSRDHHDTPPRHTDGSVNDFKVDSPQPPQPDRHELHMGDRYLPSPLDASPAPPPPPAHRSRQSSVSPESPQLSPTKVAPSTPMRRDVLKNEAHRHSAAFNSSTRLPFLHHDSPSSPHSPIGYATPSPRQQSYDATYTSPSPRHQSHDAAYASPSSRRQLQDASCVNRSLQPTVEDAPDSPPAPLTSFHVPRHASEPAYERVHSPQYRKSPAPASPAYCDQSPQLNAQLYDEPQEYSHGDHGSPSPRPDGGYGGSSNISPQHRLVKQGREYDGAQVHHVPAHSMPTFPLLLPRTADPKLAPDTLERFNIERQIDMGLPGQQNSLARGRQMSEPPPSYNVSSRDHTVLPRDQRANNSIIFSGGPQEAPANRFHVRNMSASPTHNIPRKSVSPAPLTDQARRLSDAPFGPDSYNALNPSIVSSRSSNSARSGQERTDPNAKIVLYDGREVDPSDHLPVESWAPEPEPKSCQAVSLSDHTRRSLGGAQPMPPNERRKMRLSRAEVPSIPPYGQPEEPHTPPAVVGRNRLQKRTPRGSVSPVASSPLAPIHSENYQERQSSYGSHHRLGLTYRGSYEYPNENSAPQYEAGPPIPAKIPLMSGANGGMTELSLVEEMQRIDIGNGRSRRHGGY